MLTHRPQSTRPQAGRSQPARSRPGRPGARGGRERAASARDARVPDGRPRLSEFFSRCFVFALQLRGTAHLGDPDELRRRALGLVEQAARAARRGGVLAEDVREAEFAVVALIDEAVMTSEWVGKDRWKAAPLQLERYERFDAGELFFDRLDALRGRPDGAEALEVFFLCLALGFKGRYQFLPQEELRGLIEDVQAELLGRWEGEATPPLSPHGRPRFVAGAAPARTRATWPLVLGALVLGLALFLWGRLSVGGAAADAARRVEEVAARRPPVPVAPAPPAPARVVP